MWLAIFILAASGVFFSIYFAIKKIIKFAKNKIKREMPENVNNFPPNEPPVSPGIDGLMRFDEVAFYEIAIKEKDLDVGLLQKKYCFPPELARKMISELVERDLAHYIPGCVSAVHVHVEDVLENINYVYIGKDAKDEIYKIGRTRTLNERINKLNNNWHSDFQFLFAIKTVDYKALEDTLLKRYKKYHVKGEWFRLDVAKAFELALEYRKNIVPLTEDDGANALIERTGADENHDNVMELAD